MTSPVEIIRRKRHGQALDPAEIKEFIFAASRGEVPDYQVSALLMAVYFRGMNKLETAALTDAMVRSGTQLQWPASAGPYVDKHSTGGIGDKVSLILAPMLACCGVRVPMISGRGLGPTGGTLDKLEAIPGFRTDLSIPEFRTVVEQVGCAISGATSDLAPADKRLYALRDVTATVESIPLITASILSKKLAAGLDALVLDIKWGSGAFMQQLDEARELARSLAQVGTQAGLKTVCLITDMNQPLGRMAGNAVEVQESLDTLRGEGPADLVELCIALGAEVLLLSGRAETLEVARQQLANTLTDGRALAKFREMVIAQGGDPDAPLTIAPAQNVPARQTGYVTAIDTAALGRAIIALGGGRLKVEDRIDFTVGLEMLVRLGDQVSTGQGLVRMFASDRGVDAALRLIASAIEIGPDPPRELPLIQERVTFGS